MKKRTANQATTLPGKYYTSQEIYRAETDGIFMRLWLYVGRSSEITDPGRYLLFDVDEESVIVVRNTANEFHAFHNICRHRGTRLCRESGGRFSKSIQCPYHAWTYSLDGELIGAPNMHEVRDFESRDFSLHPVDLVEWEGGIFINLSDQPTPFKETFAKVLSKFKPWQFSELQVVRSLEYDVKANWKLILQNYSECYHCPTLHPQLNRLTPYRGSTNDLEEGPILGGPMRFAKGYESMTMTGRSCAKPLAGVSEEDLQRVYYYVIFPNMLLSLHPDYVMVHRIRRMAVDQTHIQCQWLFHPDAISKSGFNPDDAIEFWNLTNRQDWEICEFAQKGVSSRAYTPGPYAELESMIAALDREYLAALDDGALTQSGPAGHKPNISE